jgi:hypothetical protein
LSEDGADKAETDIIKNVLSRHDLAEFDGSVIRPTVKGKQYNEWPEREARFVHLSTTNAVRDR